MISGSGGRIAVIVGKLEILLFSEFENFNVNQNHRCDDLSHEDDDKALS